MTVLSYISSQYRQKSASAKALIESLNSNGELNQKGLQSFLSSFITGVDARIDSIEKSVEGLGSNKRVKDDIKYLTEQIHLLNKRIEALELSSDSTSSD